jgi:NAD(P)-dependent dehydrogenase (short-subunit alcohol dehydrogenase family)
MPAALVTGAGSGIGAACAARLARDGSTVVCADRDVTAARRTAAGLPGAVAVELDVTDEAACAEVVRSAAPLGGIDRLVTCAGVHIRVPAHLADLAEVRRVLDVNLTGTLLPAVAVARALLSAGAPGALVLIGSINSRVGQAGQVAYGAAKAGVLALARGLAAEWGSAGIRVTCVAPGLTRTPMGREALDDPDAVAATLRRTPLGRIAEPEDVAAVVAHLLGPASRHVTGALVPVDGGRLLGA